MQAVGLVGQSSVPQLLSAQSTPTVATTVHQHQAPGTAERAGFSGSSVSVRTHTEKTENTLRKCRTNYQQGLPTIQLFSQKEELNQYFSKMNLNVSD